MQPYLEELLEKHFYLMDRFFQTDWVRDDKEFQLEVKREVSHKNRLLKWLKVHGALLEHTNQVKKYGTLLTSDFLTRFMKEDIFNALLIYYNLEAVRLARSAEAEAIVDMVESAYPNSTISQVFKLKAVKDYDRSGSLLKNLSLENAVRILIQTFIDVPKWSKRLNIYYLKKYKDNKTLFTSL